MMGFKQELRLDLQPEMHETFRIIEPYFIEHGIRFEIDEFGHFPGDTVDRVYYKIDREHAPNWALDYDGGITILEDNTAIVATIQGDEERFDLHDPESLRKMVEYILQHKDD